MQSKPIRKEPRTPAVVPVRIFGMDALGKPFNSVAHTLNISKCGALLANVEVPLNLGDIIGVQKGVYKCKFRILWVGKKGTASQGQLGIESLEGAKNIWGVEDRPQSIVQEIAGADRRSFAGGGFDRERRSATRHPCDLGVQIGQPGSELKTWSRCTDISETGCYIDTTCPLSPGAFFELTLFLDAQTVVVPAEVRTSFAGIGMGIRFLFENQDDAVILRHYLRHKFGLQAVAAESDSTNGFSELDKLGVVVEQIRVWASDAHLDPADHEEVEEFAATTRRELQGLRADLSHRKMAYSALADRKLSGA